MNTNELISIPHGITSDNICISQGKELQSNTINICKPQRLEVSTILYGVNQLADPQLWNSSFCFISIFNINEYLKVEAKNIAYSLY